MKSVESLEEQTLAGSSGKMLLLTRDQARRWRGRSPQPPNRRIQKCTQLLTIQASKLLNPREARDHPREQLSRSGSHSRGSKTMVPHPGTCGGGSSSVWLRRRLGIQIFRLQPLQRGEAFLEGSEWALRAGSCAPPSTQETRVRTLVGSLRGKKSSLCFLPVVNMRSIGLGAAGSYLDIR